MVERYGIMRSDCLILVEQAAFDTALSARPAAPQTLRDPLWVTIEPHSSGIQLTTPWLTAVLSGDGNWERPIAVSAALLLPLAGKFTDAPTLRIIYVSERLFINTLSIPAIDRAQFRPSFSSGRAPRLAQQRELFSGTQTLSRWHNRNTHPAVDSLPLFSRTTIQRPNPK